MLISHSHRFIFIHVGKTGGISIRRVLQPYCVEPERFRMRRPMKMVGDRPNPLFTVWETLLLHAKARDVRKELSPEVFDSFYRFAFVRNPWDWHVSMYHFILAQPAAPMHAEVKALGGFEGYVDWVARAANPFPRGIARLQKDMVTDAEGRLLVDFIGHYETLAADFRRVRERIGIDGDLPHLNRSEHRDYRMYYNERTRRAIGEAFGANVEAFGYTFDGLRQVSQFA